MEIPCAPITTLLPPPTPDPFPGTGHAGSRQRRGVWSPENGVFCGILAAKLAEKWGENAPHHRKCPEMLQTRLESRLERKVNAEYEKDGLMGKNRLIDELLLPWVNIFLSAPLTALVPVLMVLFGFGMKSIIITTTLFAIWIIMLNSRAGVLQINRSLVEMANVFGASPLEAFFKIYVWAALPEILGGVRIGIIRAVKGCNNWPAPDFNRWIWSLV